MAGVVLAGGQSRRMGQDKALLDFLGQPLVRRIVERLEGVSPPVYVVAPQHRRGALEALGLRVVADRFEQGGPLAGLHAGLAAAGDGYHFVVSCDQPFVEGGLVRYLLRRAQASLPPQPGTGYLAPDAVIPRVEGKLQVLHAVYHGRVAPVAERLLRQGERSVRCVLERIRWVEVAEAELAAFGDPGRLFLNVNTPDELRLALRLACEEGPFRPGP